MRNAKLSSVKRINKYPHEKRQIIVAVIETIINPTSVGFFMNEIFSYSSVNGYRVVVIYPPDLLFPLNKIILKTSEEPGRSKRAWVFGDV